MKYNALPVAFLCGFVLVIFASMGAFSTWNAGLTDVLYGGKPALESIVIVGIDDQSLQEIGRWPWDRDTFVPLLNATAKARTVAFDIAFFEPTDQDDVLAQAMDERVVLAEEYDFARGVLMQPVPAFDGIRTGVVNIFTDTDGISRRIPLELQGRESFTVAAYETYLGRELSAADASLLVNYAGPPGTFTTYSASDVILGRVSSSQFADKLVIVGATAPDLHDDYLVPTSQGNRMPGVEIHANAVRTLLTKQYLRHQSFASLALLIFLFSALVGLALTYLRYLLAGPLLVGLWILHAVIAIFIFHQGIILNLVYPGMTLIVTSLVCVSYVATREKQHRARVQSLFGKYVSKDIVTHLLENEDAVKLGGEEREITAMFADIRGFTAMSENMTPHEVINMLNHYFGDMTDIIFKHKGTLDKFIGDCLFAVWGSPLENKDHALHAIEACLEIQKVISDRDHPGVPPIDLGIGMCSGPAVIGNMGSPQRQEFTALGDTVNTASRMAGKAEGGQIVITQSTYDLVKDHVRVKKLEPVKVKGKEKPLQIYLVNGMKSRK